MTDYEAVYESVMRYAKTSASEVNSEQKLARYLRENDVKNRMSEKLIDRLVETRKAQQDIESARAATGGDVRASRAESFRENRESVRREQRFINANGFRTEGTVTLKKTGAQRVVFQTQGKYVYYDAEKKRAREVEQLPTGEFRSTGRFAKTPKMFDR